MEPDKICLLYFATGLILCAVMALFDKKRESFDYIMVGSITLTLLWPIFLPTIIITVIHDLRGLPEHEDTKKT